MNRYILYISLVLLIASCAKKEFKLKTGDLIFTVSKENSDFVNAIKNSTANKEDIPYSHVGIVSIENGEPFVIEATAPEGVVKTPLQDFIAKTALLNNKPVMAVGRLHQDYNYSIAAAIEKASSLLGQSYDYAYDESNDSYYCSELVRYAFVDSANNSIFPAIAMSFKNKETGETEPFWITHYQKLNQRIPEGMPGTNPMDMSKAKEIEIVHYYYE